MTANASGGGGASLRDNSSRSRSSKAISSTPFDCACASLRRRSFSRASQGVVSRKLSGRSSPLINGPSPAAPASEGGNPIPISSSRASVSGISRRSYRARKASRKRDRSSSFRGLMSRLRMWTPRRISSSTAFPSRASGEGLVMSTWKRRGSSTGGGRASRRRATSL